MSSSGNPNHDPKSGEFTGPGAGASVAPPNAGITPISQLHSANNLSSSGSLHMDSLPDDLNPSNPQHQKLVEDMAKKVAASLGISYTPSGLSDFCFPLTVAMQEHLGNPKGFMVYAVGEGGEAANHTVLYNPKKDIVIDTSGNQWDKPVLSSGKSSGYSFTKKEKFRAEGPLPADMVEGMRTEVMGMRRDAAAGYKFPERRF